MRRALEERPFSIPVLGPFSLGASARFLAGWPPAEGFARDSGEGIGVAFAIDDFSGHAAVHVRPASLEKYRCPLPVDPPPSEPTQLIALPTTQDTSTTGAA